jgi:hypothetical protein
VRPLIFALVVDVIAILGALILAWTILDSGFDVCWAAGIFILTLVIIPTQIERAEEVK